MLYLLLLLGCTTSKVEYNTTCLYPPKSSPIYESTLIYTNNLGINIGDVYVYRDGRIILGINHGQIIYKQLFLIDNGWTTTTNAMPLVNFTNNWIKMEL